MKILYVLSYLSRNGGVQSVVNNYFKNMDKKEISIDFLTLLPGDKNMEEELEKEGCNVYHIKGSEEKNLFLLVKEIKKFFKNHHDYDIIHSHQTNLDIFYLREAKKWKIPVRIMHSHSTNCDISRIRMKVIKVMSKIYANYYVACSKDAGRWMFGKSIDKSNKFYVMNNAINLEKYLYNETIRKRIRKENNLENSFVVGNVSRMTEIKNHKFLIDIFNEILKINNNSKLLLIGDGPLKESLQKQVEQLNIEDKVIFYGTTNKVNEILQGMDVFVLPSKFEGVPVTIVEAAASGIKYVISDNIDSHLLKNDLELKLELNLTSKEWAEKIIKFSYSYNRKNEKELLRKSRFDIQEESKNLEEFYKKAIREVKNA